MERSIFTNDVPNFTRFYVIVDSKIPLDGSAGLLSPNHRASYEAKANTPINGISPHETRLIGEKGDKLLRVEKQNFLRKYLLSAYNYDAESYPSQISKAGDLMSQALWREKEAEFGKLGESLKGEAISQKAKIEDLREIDPDTYQADLSILVQNKLKEIPIKLRIDLSIKRNERREDNPYPYEMVGFEEQVIAESEVISIPEKEPS